jgi:hypothetical protein
MNNSMILDVAAGIVTSVSIILFVAFNVISFNKHVRERRIG